MDGGGWGSGGGHRPVSNQRLEVARSELEIPRHTLVNTDLLQTGQE